MGLAKVKKISSFGFHLSSFGAPKSVMCERAFSYEFRGCGTAENGSPILKKKKAAEGWNRTRVFCVECCSANHSATSVMKKVIKVAYIYYGWYIV